MSERMPVWRVILVLAAVMVAATPGLSGCRPDAVGAEGQKGIPTAAPTAATSAPTRTPYLSTVEASPTGTPQSTPTPADTITDRISGHVMWGPVPVADARVELVDEVGDTVTEVVTDRSGRYVIDAAPVGELRLVAVWPDGTPNQVSVTPVNVDAGASFTDVDLYLVRELAWGAPESGAEVSVTPALSWGGLPEVAEYCVSVVEVKTAERILDARTTGTGLVVTTPLTAGQTYSWTVSGLATEGADVSDGSVLATLTSEFRTAPPPLLGPSCMAGSVRRELKEPYQRYHGQARYTLSAEELETYMRVMGIESLCVPRQFGAPFLNVDWDSASNPGTTGRMISLGFEGLYRGAGWGEAFILFSTYDFATASEYDIFAWPEDRVAVQEGTMPDAIEVDGVKGFIRFKPSDFSFGRRTVFKAYIFPSEDHYVAVVCALGDYDVETDWMALIRDLWRSAYPLERQRTVDLADALAMSLTFGNAR